MKSEKVKFENKDGQEIAAKLELPLDQHPHNYAIFAHCFTCSKDLKAVRNISRALTLNGIAVLRFDFTGLGESEGDFADTNFSTNVSDLVAAANFLKEEHQAPSILIGHSLGGAAVLLAAHQLESVKAVATIGAPFSPQHVKHLIKGGLEKLKQEGKAEVNIGGRPFTIKQHFIENLEEVSTSDHINELDRALLIMHSPQDQTVELENAEKIYKAARHPKSFVTLDNANHLLSKRADSMYAGEVIASWAKRYIEMPEDKDLKTDKQVLTKTGNDGFLTDIQMGKHSIVADEPEDVGGYDYGPAPYDLLAAALGACTGMTLRMYANRKKWDLKEVRVHLKHHKDYPSDCENCDDDKSKIDHIDREIELSGELDEKQRKRLLEIANKCPVHKTLHSDIEVKSSLRDS